MDRLFRIDFYPQDWLIDTARLTPEERGIFIQIVCLIYSNRGPIDNDAAWIAGVSGCSSRLVKTIIASLEKKGFIQFSGSKITQKRAENELKVKRNHLEHSAKGGRNKAENEREYNENNDIVSSDPINPLPSPSPSPSPIAKEKEDSLSLTLSENGELDLPEPPSRKTPGAQLARFDEVLQAYPKGTGSGQARSVYSNLILHGKATHEQLVAAASVAGELYKDRDNRFIPNLAKFLTEDWDSREVTALIARRKPAALGPDAEAQRQWRGRMKAWLWPNNRWNAANGPQPHEEGTLVPAAVLQEFAADIARQTKQLEDGFAKIIVD